MLGLAISVAALLLDAMAILDIFGSARGGERKAFWIVVVLLLPLAGPLLYYALARGVRRPG